PEGKIQWKKHLRCQNGMCNQMLQFHVRQLSLTLKSPANLTSNLLKINNLQLNVKRYLSYKLFFSRLDCIWRGAPPALPARHRSGSLQKARAFAVQAPKPLATMLVITLQTY